MGVNGQDGSYLAELLLSKGYQVVGWVPDSIPVSYQNIKHILDSMTVVKGDLLDQDGLMDLIQTSQPDEVYNLASPSSPSASWKDTVYVSNVTALGVARLLEAIRLKCPQARFYQASSSELFGNPVEVPQNENTPFHPRNPYGIAKLHAHWLTDNYRKKYDLFAVSGILYNHESPRRGLNFVTRKITRGAARIKLGLSDELRLGNLEARRDWGFAGDYVKAMWLMLQQDQPKDFVVGTGETHSVREFCETAFKSLDLDYRNYVKSVPEYFRPVEDNLLVADISKVKRELGWKTQIKFENLIQKMVSKDIKLCKATL
jgi:GDPmannose 4,6-dehydratase